MSTGPMANMVSSDIELPARAIALIAEASGLEIRKLLRLVCKQFKTEVDQRVCSLSFGELGGSISVSCSNLCQSFKALSRLQLTPSQLPLVLASSSASTQQITSIVIQSNFHTAQQTFGRPQVAVGLEPLARLRNLRHLAICDVVIRSGESVLLQLPHLETIDLSRCFEVNNRLLSLLTRLPNLQTIYFPAPTCFCPRLNQCTLQGMQLSLLAMRKLRALHLRSCDLEVHGVGNVKRCEGCTVITPAILEQVTMRMANLRALSLEHLSDRRVTTVHGSDPTVAPNGRSLGSMLTVLAHLDQLEHLSLSPHIALVFPDVTRNSMDGMFAGKVPSSGVPCADISDEVVAYLCSKLKKLKMLELKECWDLGLDTIVAAVGLPALTYLDLTGSCRFMDPSQLQLLEPLGQQLQTLVLARWGAPGWALPHCARSRLAHNQQKEEDQLLQDQAAVLCELAVQLTHDMEEAEADARSHGEVPPEWRSLYSMDSRHATCGMPSVYGASTPQLSRHQLVHPGIDDLCMASMPYDTLPIDCGSSKAPASQQLQAAGSPHSASSSHANGSLSPPSGQQHHVASANSAPSTLQSQHQHPLYPDQQTSYQAGVGCRPFPEQQLPNSEQSPSLAELRMAPPRTISADQEYTSATLDTASITPGAIRVGNTGSAPRGVGNTGPKRYEQTSSAGAAQGLSIAQAMRARLAQTEESPRADDAEQTKELTFGQQSDGAEAAIPNRPPTHLLGLPLVSSFVFESRDSATCGHDYQDIDFEDFLDQTGSMDRVLASRLEGSLGSGGGRGSGEWGHGSSSDDVGVDEVEKQLLRRTHKRIMTSRFSQDESREEQAMSACYIRGLPPKGNKATLAQEHKQLLGSCPGNPEAAAAAVTAGEQAAAAALDQHIARLRCREPSDVHRVHFQDSTKNSSDASDTHLQSSLWSLEPRPSTAAGPPCEDAKDLLGAGHYWSQSHGQWAALAPETSEPSGAPKAPTHLPASILFSSATTDNKTGGRRNCLSSPTTGNIAVVDPDGAADAAWRSAVVRPRNELGVFPRPFASSDAEWSMACTPRAFAEAVRIANMSGMVTSPQAHAASCNSSQWSALPPRATSCSGAQASAQNCGMLGFTSGLKQLQNLDLSGWRQLSPEDLSALSQLSELARLQLSDCQLQPGHISALGLVPSLVDLDLSFTRPSKEVIEAVQKLSNVSRINLAWVQATWDVSKAIASLQKMPGKRVEGYANVHTSIAVLRGMVAE